MADCNGTHEVINFILLRLEFQLLCNASLLLECQTIARILCVLFSKIYELKTVSNNPRIAMILYNFTDHGTICILFISYTIISYKLTFHLHN